MRAGDYATCGELVGSMRAGAALRAAPNVAADEQRQTAAFGRGGLRIRVPAPSRRKADAEF